MIAAELNAGCTPVKSSMSGGMAKYWIKKMLGMQYQLVQCAPMQVNGTR
jgi:hypothetical protein